jgi:hypothetical protein
MSDLESDLKRLAMSIQVWCQMGYLESPYLISYMCLIVTIYHDMHITLFRIYKPLKNEWLWVWCWRVIKFKSDGISGKAIYDLVLCVRVTIGYLTPFRSYKPLK